MKQTMRVRDEWRPIAATGGDGKSGGVAPKRTAPAEQLTLGNAAPMTARSGPMLANSGLARFGATGGGYQPQAYIPRNFSVPQLQMSSMSGAGSAVGGARGSSAGGFGMAGNFGGGSGDPSSAGGGQSGGFGGVSVNGAGQLGRGAGVLAGMTLGLGPLAGYMGRLGDDLAVSAASAANGPGDPGATDVGSLGAVNGSDSMSNGYGGSGAGGFGGDSGSGGGK